VAGHDIRPGRLVAGLAALGTAVAYAGDAADAWHTPWFAAFPVMFLGLFGASVVTWTHYGIRRRRLKLASTENDDAPASTSGSQAMR
jgi:hypothetical protein